MANNQRYIVQFRDGTYAKLGGSQTDNIQEAEVIGWTKKSQDRWTSYGCKLIPVTINLVPAKETKND